MFEPRHALRAIAWVLVAAVAASAQTPAGARRALDHADYDIWNRITGQQLAGSGQWALYTLTAEASDPRLVVRPLAGGEALELTRAEAGQFSHDSRFVVFRIKPGKDTVRLLRAARTPAAQLPQDSIGILDLATGRIARAERLRGFKLPAKAGGWVAYHQSRPPADNAQRDTAAGGAAPATPAAQAARPGTATGRAGGANRREEGSPLVVHALATGEERRIEDVVAYEFSEDGARLVYATGTRDGTNDGVHVLELASGTTRTLLSGKGEYKGLVLDEAGRQVAFLSNRDDIDADRPTYTLYHWDGRAAQARALAAAGTAGVPDGWAPSEHGTPAFSANGQRLFFGTAPKPLPDPPELPEDERVVLDIWNWQDALLQPMQLRQLDQERRRTYQAVAHLRDGRIVQLASETVPDVTLVRRGDADWVLGRSNLPYQQEISWGESGSDIYHVDVRTGATTKLVEYVRSNAAPSPDGRYVSWWDGDALTWRVMDVRSREIADVAAAIPYPVHNELHDSPSLPNAYGAAGWTKDDERFLIYDSHDIWAVDPAGRAAPRNVTAGYGRRENLRLRYVDLEGTGPAGFGPGGFGGAAAQQRSIDPSADIVLQAFHHWTKAGGFYRTRVNADAAPARLVMDDRSFGTPRKAEQADVVLFTRGSFREFPDLYVADTGFADIRRISDANPQQAGYRWGTAELVEWPSSHGETLQGVLYKPDGFDPSRKYPLLVYFYERLSQSLHNHFVPAAGGSSINISFYVSRGYVVFTPDIPYRVGYPGESAMSAVVPGVLSLLEKGFIDRDRIGVQGHSWGGYQILYMITRTNLFAAAEAGAPVSNMISAYGGIRWSTGMVRQFQYEKTQSRIGGTLWERPLQFIENSPIFWADKVETPLLMLHNDEDGAVPWYQGIEFFTALRRLGRPVWMLNYNGEDHGLRRAQNQKDWAVRMQQFFDHYLMDAPPPVWMAEGVRAVDKGRTLGLELVGQPRPAVAAEAGNGRQ